MNAPASSRRSPAVQGRRRRPRSVFPTRASSTSCPIFVLYGNVSDARDALLRATRLLRPDQSARGVLPMFWRFDQLAGPRMRAMALRDAARAEAVVLALGRETELNLETDAWLGELARQQRGAAIHVLTLMGDDAWTISLEQAHADVATPTESRPAERASNSAAAKPAFNRGPIAAAA